MRRSALLVLLLCTLPFCATDAFARIGGGDTYSGSSDSESSYDDSSSDSSSYDDSGSSSSGSSGSSGGGGDLSPGVAFLLFFVLMFFVGGGALTNAAVSSRSIIRVAPQPPAPTDLSALRKYDPNFSEIVFTDFCYSLFARLHEARGRGRVDDFAPYVAGAVRDGIKKHHPAGVTSVDQIVIGSFAILSVTGLDTPRVKVGVTIEANYTETSSAGTQRWYVHERWSLERLRDILSPAPGNARAEHCPKCGAPLQTRTDGACLHCGSVVEGGAFQWFLSSVSVERKDQRAPVLTGGGGGPEPGLDRPSVIQYWIGKRMAKFAESHPGFSWEAFDARVRLVANELQAAWTARDWERARHYETDALFQMHRYWIDEYRRQGLRNVVDDYSIDKTDVVKVTSDAFYDAITVRLYASGADFTIDDSGAVVGGSRQNRKQWSEYWTLIRGRAGAASARVCPNCGATRGEGQTVVCEYCGGKISTGEFPWILSRIEQDEAYLG